MLRANQVGRARRFGRSSLRIQAIGTRSSDAIKRSIDILPDDFRTVILLRDIEELSTEETAEILETTPGAIKTRLHRARQAIRRVLLLSCTTCPEHGFLRCACDLPLRTTDATRHAETHPPRTVIFPDGSTSISGCLSGA